MNRVIRILGAAGLAAFALACGGDGGHATAPVVPNPSFEFTNGPSSAGAVLRAVLDGVPILWFSTDPNRNLMSIQGPASNTVLCGGTQAVSGLNCSR